MFIVLDQYGGNVGLAITQAMGLTGMFQWGMRQSTEMENQMTSVERYLFITSLAWKYNKELEAPPLAIQLYLWKKNHINAISPN